MEHVIDLVRAIRADRSVMSFGRGRPGEYRWHDLDLRDEDALLDELTSPHSSGAL